MRGALVMTMAMISPSGREVAPAKQLRQSPRLVPPRFGLVAAEFRPRKNHKQAYERNSAATRRNLGGTNLGLWQSCSAGETSLREGEIIAMVITNAPLIRRGQSPSTSSSAPSHLKTLVHLLYPIFVPKPQIGTCGMLVVLITPCS